MGNRGAKATIKRSATTEEEEANAAAVNWKHDDEDAPAESRLHRQPSEAAAATTAACHTSEKVPKGAASPPEAVVSGLRLVEGVVEASEHEALVSWVRQTLELGRAGKLPGMCLSPTSEYNGGGMLQFGTYTHSNRVSTCPSRLCPPAAAVDKLISAGAITESEI